MAELSVRGLTVSYGTTRVLDDVSLELPASGTLGLVGESGSGKSTVAKAIAGLVRPDAGDITIQGGPQTGRRPRRRCPTVQMIFQDPRGSLNPRMTVGELLEEATRAARRHGLADSTAPPAETLASVGLGAELAGRYPHQLSGGQLQRIAIARCLIMQPRVLIADEPTSALDVSVQATILRLLRELQHQRRYSMLFISHDLAVVHYMSDEIAVMRAGSIVERGPATSVIHTPQHHYTRELLASVPPVPRHRRRSVQIVPRSGKGIA